MSIGSSKTSKADLVLQEASAWFIEFRTEEPSVADRARFYEWLRKSPDHIQAYLEIAEGWAALPTADPEHRLDIQALIQQARESRDENVIALSPRSIAISKPRRPKIVAWAASLAALALITGLAFFAYSSQANTYRTGIGEQRTVRLADGSTIELNARSRVRVSLSEDKREVDLTEGQALFRVAKDMSRPFVVHANGTRVRAVGTQFDVYRKSTGTVVTVLEGRVAVEEGAESGGGVRSSARLQTPLLLVAGEQVTVSSTHSSAEKHAPKPKHADVGVATAWVHKRLIFEETPLAEVAEEFNRYSTHRLVIVDPQLQSIQISGVYSSADPDSLLGFLRAQSNIQLDEINNEIRISQREKK